MNIALINTNRIHPPIAPIGLDYCAEALDMEGHEVKILDLCWAEDYHSAIADFFSGQEFTLTGVTLRNTDDCAFASRQSFLKEFAEIIDTIRKQTDALIVLGGIGFSVMPEEVLKLSHADIGIGGDGEFPLVELAQKIEKNEKWQDVPNLIYCLNGTYVHTPPHIHSLANLPSMTRRWIDNRRYFSEGGQGGFETKRGCHKKCIYCADPIAKGNKVRMRPPKAVVDEIENLYAQGIDHLHTCDSEFNLIKWHSVEICKELIRRSINKKIRWYAYCSPTPFTHEIARLMKRAGCAGINFGADHGDIEMLKRLGRDFTPDDIVNAVCICKETGIAVMVDLLLGAPYENRMSIVRTIELMQKITPDRVGISLGVRVYPGTPLSQLILDKGLTDGCVGGENFSTPLFFLEPGIAPFVFELLDELIGEDKRFFFFDPSRPERNYNYNANVQLINAIKNGCRGAYWDILRLTGNNPSVLK